MTAKSVFARISVTLTLPDEMTHAIVGVLQGEYEPGYDGRGLTILDIGANVGSFAIWASLRWPQSRIYAYEPQPATFEMLVRNVRHLPEISCEHAAVLPSERKLERLRSRYPGDGESGLVAYMSDTFANLPEDQILSVPVLHPRRLPTADLIKLDVEGAEAKILENMNLDQVSLILLEYQNRQNRDRIVYSLNDYFRVEREHSFPWDPLLPKSSYRKDLKGNAYGTLILVNTRQNRLLKAGMPTVATERTLTYGMSEPSLRQILKALPRATKNALQRRLRNYR
jgi:FkbM family methyltransferase